MSRSAWIYVFGVIIAGLALTGLAFMATDLNQADWMAFVVLTALATYSELFQVETSRQSYYTTLIFLFAGVLLLPPFLFALLVITSYSIEWLKERLSNSHRLRNWYLQPFNMAAHIISGVVARSIFQASSDPHFTWTLPALPAAIRVMMPAVGDDSVALTISLIPLVVAIAAVAYVFVNHMLVGWALVLGRRVSLRESGVMTYESLSNELILLLMGAVMYQLWVINPWFAPLALAPLALMFRALQVPKLKMEASTDPKTGLWNARHFMQAFTSEMERAQRFDRPLSIIMSDLDLLRNINNTYGHLAGDAVLAGIAQVIRVTIRDYDVAARFGGEEFAILLPETTFDDAQILAERLRATVANTPYRAETLREGINATLSLGVAAFPLHGSVPNELIHAADLAVYQAKLRGRNCIVGASDVPHSTRFEPLGPEARQHESYPIASVPRLPLEQAAAESAVTASAAPPSVPSPLSHQPVAAPSAAPLMEQPSPKWLSLFVAAIIAAGLSLTLGVLRADALPALAVFHGHASADPLAATQLIALLMLLAFGAEIFHVSLYGDGTVSVSAALNFAAALIVGLPGVLWVSAAIAIGDRLALALERRFVLRQALYKVPFNWATHVLAGAAPALGTVPLEYLSLGDLSLTLHITTSLIAALAYYLIETGSVAMVIALSTGAKVTDIWREKFRWLGSHYVALGVIGIFLCLGYQALGLLGILAFVLPVLMMRVTQKEYIDRTKDSIQELKRMNAELVQANHEVIAANSAMGQLNDSLFLTLSKIIDARDPYVMGHSGKLADYAVAIAQALGFDEGRWANLRQAAFLHDIGKIGIPEQILHKPARLTAEEYEIIKTHAALGADFLETAQGLRHLAPFVRHHHEWWNGKGYPNQLSGEQIPLEARILSVCDAVETMASDRPYHRGISLPEIVKELQRCAGTQFDPEVVKVFLHVAESSREPLVTNSAREVKRAHTEQVDSVPLYFGIHPLTSKP